MPPGCFEPPPPPILHLMWWELVLAQVDGCTVGKRHQLSNMWCFGGRGTIEEVPGASAKALGGDLATMLPFIHPFICPSIHLSVYVSIHPPKCRLYPTVAVMVLLTLFLGGSKTDECLYLKWHRCCGGRTIKQTASDKSSGSVSRIIEKLPTCKWVPQREPTMLLEFTVTRVWLMVHPRVWGCVS